MPYTLTLTADERRAMDWIGGRYWWGDDLRAVLMGDCLMMDDETERHSEWDDNTDLTFRVPEHVAWTIQSELEAEDGFMPCAGRELSAKLRQFCDSIV